MDMKRLAIAVGVAALLWFAMFSPWTGGRLNFWLVMSGAAVVLGLLSAWAGRDFRKQFRFTATDIAVGCVSAVVLWGIFYAGNFFSSQLFDFARPQVSEIYRMKEGENPLLVGALLLLPIGPAEEIFWRGYVQRTLAARYGERSAPVITAVTYALVHVWSFNFMLLMAALVCGLFWGLLYRFRKNTVTLIVSHALWDVAVFVLFPIEG
jgi:membrane protease YdiL (CAAX protease family)